MEKEIEILNNKQVFKKLLETYIDILNNRPCCYFDIKYGFGAHSSLFENCTTNNNGLGQIKAKIIDSINSQFSSMYLDIYKDVLSYSINDNSNNTKDFDLAYIESVYFIPYYKKPLKQGIILKENYNTELNSTNLLFIKTHQRYVRWFQTDLKDLLLNKIKDKQRLRSKSDGKTTYGFVEDKINEYTLEYFDNYVKSNSAKGGLKKFVKKELAFIDKKIAENKNYGFLLQLFKHKKNIILQYKKNKRF